jgi:hypothetical protein
METVSTLPIATKTVAGAISTTKRTVWGMAPVYPVQTQIASLTRLPTSPSHAIIIDPA